jgi:hypothetical protein
MTDAKSVLPGILRRVRDGGVAQPVAVFDLDGTIFTTVYRSHAVFTEAAEALPALRPVVESRRPDDWTWNWQDDFRRGGITDERLMANLMAFWRERFFASPYMVHDRPIPGAVEYVNALYDAGAALCYLTGRDRPGMGEGTVAALQRCRFPYGVPRTELIMKARFDQPDEEHKRSAIERIRTMGQVVAAFDNEPELVNLFADVFPEATVVLVHSVHSPKPVRPYDRVVQIHDFLTDDK